MGGMKENKEKEGKSISSKNGWSQMSEKKKLFAVCFLVAILVLTFVFIYTEFKRMNDITPIDSSEYARLLNNLDGCKWRASKNGYKILLDEDLLYSSDCSYTYITDKSIILEFDSVWASFDYDSGLIRGSINFEPALMFFSESIIKTGRALTLVLNGNKIVFYQE